MTRNSRESVTVQQFTGDALPTWRGQLWVRLAAGRDARNGVLSEPDAPAPDHHVWTPFIAEVFDAAAEVDAQARARLEDRNRELIGEIYRRADAVVLHHDTFGQHQTPHHHRLVYALATWSTEVADTGGLVNATVARYNQLIHAYWGRLLLLHARLSDGGRPTRYRPATLQVNGIWSDPIALLPEVPPARPPLRSPLARAVEIVGPAMAPTTR